MSSIHPNVKGAVTLTELTVTGQRGWVCPRSAGSTRRPASTASGRPQRHSPGGDRAGRLWTLRDRSRSATPRPGVSLRPGPDRAPRPGSSGPRGPALRAAAVGLTAGGSDDRRGRQSVPQPERAIAGPYEPSAAPRQRSIRLSGTVVRGRHRLMEVPAYRDRWADPLAREAPETNRDHRSMTPLPLLDRSLDECLDQGRRSPVTGQRITRRQEIPGTGTHDEGSGHQMTFSATPTVPYRHLRAPLVLHLPALELGAQRWPLRGSGAPSSCHLSPVQ